MHLFLNLKMKEIYIHTLIITLIQQVISIFGIIFNLAVVWITIKNKNLHNSCGLLLAIYSFSEFALESATLLPTVLVCIDTKISLLLCFYVSFFQTNWGCFNAFFSMSFIGLDRLLAYIFPIFYQFVLRKGYKKYVMALNLISFGYIFVFMYFNYQYALRDKEKNVYCEPGDLSGDLTTWALYNLIVLNLLTIFTYSILGIAIKFKKPKIENSSENDNGDVQRTKRLYKSLAVIVGVNFFLYFMGAFGAQFIIPMLTNDPQMSFLYFRLFAQLITVAGAINAPVLYFCSSEYRAIMNHHFPIIRSALLFCRISDENSCNIVVPAPTSTVPPNPKNNYY